MTSTEEQKIIFNFPVWTNLVWGPLQSEDFESAGENLRSILEYFSDEDLNLIFWRGIIEGIPAVRGAITPDKWSDVFLPEIAKLFIDFTNGKIISDTYQHTKLDIIKKFHPLVVASIPGGTPEEKLKLLKTVTPSTHIYFTANPAQIFGFGIFPAPEKLPKNEKKKPEYQLGFLSEIMKYALFSFDTANEIFLAAQNKKLDEKKTSALAYAVGSVLLGITAQDNFSETLKDVLDASPEECEFLAKDIREKIFEKNRKEIKELFEGTKEAVVPAGESVSLEVFGFDKEKAEKETSIKITQTKEDGAIDAPLVLHREKPSPFGFPKTQISQSSGKSFSLPFGFFKSKTTESPTGPVRVKVELPGVMKAEDKKTVHYSELRTPITPFQKEKSFITTDAREKTGGEVIKIKTPVDVVQKNKESTVNLLAANPKKELEDRENIKKIFSSIPTTIPQIKKEPRPESLPEIKSILQKNTPAPVISSPTIPTSQKTEPNEKKIEETTSGEKPQLTGKGFFWHFPKKKKEDAPSVGVPKTGPEIEGNKLNLKN